MKLDKALDSFAFEQPSLDRPVRQHGFSQKSMQLAAEPMADWDAKTHLGPVQVLRRQQLSQYFLQEILGCHSTKLEILGQTGLKFNYVVIQERRPGFEGDSHAR